MEFAAIKTRTIATDGDVKNRPIVLVSDLMKGPSFARCLTEFIFFVPPF